MSRSKSPEFIDKPRDHAGSLAQNNPVSFNFPASNFSKIFLHSGKTRNDSNPNIRSTKKIRRKKSIGLIKSPISQSPSISNITPKEKPLIQSVHYLDPTKRIEDALVKIRRIDRESLKDAKKLYQMSVIEDKLELFNEIFDIIIEKDRVFGKYLLMIKEFYMFIFSEKIRKNYSEIEVKEKEWGKEKQKLLEENESIRKLVENLSKENFRLSKDLDKCEDHIDKLQDELDFIQNFNGEKAEYSKESWRNLIKQNKYYKEMCKNLKEDLKVYEHNQNMFLKKFDELKEQGVGIYYEYTDDVKSSKSSDFFPLEATDKKEQNKPIPALKFDKIRHESNLS